MVHANRNKFVELELAVEAGARRGDDYAEHESVHVEVCNERHRAA